MTAKVKKWMIRLMTVLFQAAIIVALLTRFVCCSRTENYQDIQPEFTGPDVIAAVLYREDLGQLYVCYNDASCVNVYTEDGTFLWAVSTPYLRTSEFTILDGKLIIHNYDAYVYDAANGSFLELTNTDALHLPDMEAAETEELQVGDFYYDAYQVYRLAANGDAETIVSRPWWYIFTNFVACWLVAAVCAIGLGVLLLYEKAAAWWIARRQAQFEKKKEGSE